MLDDWRAPMAGRSTHMGMPLTTERSTCNSEVGMENIVFLFLHTRLLLSFNSVDGVFLLRMFCASHAHGCCFSYSRCVSSCSWLFPLTVKACSFEAPLWISSSGRTTMALPASRTPRARLVQACTICIYIYICIERER